MESRGHALISLRPHFHNSTCSALMDFHLSLSAVTLEFPARGIRELSEQARDGIIGTCRNKRSKQYKDLKHQGDSPKIST
jgi:hypothetical protein